MIISNNIHKCMRCELSVIQGEKHQCPLEGATQIGYVLIKGRLYVNWVLIGNILEDCKSKIIQPIPVPSYLRASDDSIQRDKNEMSDDNGPVPSNIKVK